MEKWIAQLQHADPVKRKEAIMMVGRQRCGEALPALAHIYHHDPVPELRDLALKAGRYIKQHQPPPDPESAPRVGDEKLGQQHTRLALDAHLDGNKARALRELVLAYHANPALEQDEVFLNLASQVLMCERETAVRLLSDDQRLSTVIKQTPNASTKKKGRKQASLFRRWLLAGAVCLLLVLGYIFVVTGTFDRYVLYFRMREINAQTERHELDNGQEYFVYIPAQSTPSEGWMVIVALHGYAGYGRHMIQPDLVDVADETHALLIAPSFSTYDDDPNTVGQYNGGLQRNLTLILGEIAQEYRVHPNGVVLYGFSRGAMFVTEFTANYPLLLAGVVAEDAPKVIVPERRVSYPPCYLVYGENDGNLPFNLGAINEMQAQGYPVTLEVVPNAGHEMTKQGMSRLRQMVRQARATE